MSAVSSGSAQGNAELHESDSSTPAGHAPADFGANEWLVEELYQRYLADPSSVDRAWWSFFADFRPATGNGASAPAPSVPAPAAPAAAPSSAAPPPAAPGAEASRLRGAAARTVTNMTASLAVPTATSVRSVPAKA